MESPSRKELEILLEKRGRKALAMYAWRGALRVLPLLGRRSIKQSWPKDTTTHIYSVLRVYWLLYWYCTSDRLVDTNFFVQAAIEARNAWHSAYVAYAAYADAAYAAADAAYADAANAAVDAAYAAYAAYAAADAADAVDTYYYAAKKANRVDYQSLLNDPNPIKACYLQPLWPDGIPEELAKNWDSLISDLNHNQLDFLATDIKLLFQGGDLDSGHEAGFSQHIERYLGHPSESITASAKSLRQFILGKTISENQAVRAMLIGPGGAGKTSLWQLLTQRKVEDKPKVTKGVEYHDHTAVDLVQHKDALAKVKDWRDLDLYLWDFGGQAIFHSLHSAFMKENCVYILVVDSRHEQAPDEWLYQIDDLTGGKADVLLVTNFFDEVERQQNITNLLRRFDRLLTKDRFFNFSCRHTDESFDVFVKKLVETALSSRRKILPCVQVAADILDTHFKSQKRIEYRDLRKAMSGWIASDQIEQALDGLKILGRIVHIDSRECCLKPEWIIHQAYCLLSSSLSQQYKGLIDDDVIFEVFETLPEYQQQDKKVSTGLVRQVMAFLDSLDLCIDLSERNAYIAEYFIPDAAVASEPPYLKALLKTTDSLTFAYELCYVPAKLKAQLIHHLFTLPDVVLDLPSGVWRDGVIVYDKNKQDLIVVEYQYRRQRIELTLVGKPDGELPKLLGAIDTALEKISGRQLIGHMRLEDKGRDMPFSAFSTPQVVKVDDSIRQDMVDVLVEAIKKFGLNLTIQQVNEMKANSDNIHDNNVNNSAIGPNASNKVNISNSYNNNQPLTKEQQTDLIEALKQLLQQTAIQGADTSKIQLLADAKSAVEQGVEPQNEQTQSFLHELYGAMAEVDKTAGMMEKAHKYVAPLVIEGMKFLGL